jgi:hypothetical protein
MLGTFHRCANTQVSVALILLGLDHWNWRAGQVPVIQAKTGDPPAPLRRAGQV